MKSVVVYLAKKYIIAKINDVISKNKDNVQKICDIIQRWTQNLNVICSELTKISIRCQDGQLDSQEVDDSIDEIETIIKEFK